MKLCPFQYQNILIMQHMELHCGFVVTFLSLFSFFPWKKKSWIKLRDNLKVLSSLYANWVTTNSCYLTHFMNNQKATEHVLCLFVSTLYKGCSEASVPCRSCLMNKGQYTLFFEKLYRYMLLLIFKELTPNWNDSARETAPPREQESLQIMLNLKVYFWDVSKDQGSQRRLCGENRP